MPRVKTQERLELKILSHLYCFGTMPRKNLFVPFSYTAYPYYTTVLKKLINETYVHVYRTHRLNWVEITRTGVQFLRSELGEAGMAQLDANQIKTSNRASFTRRLLIADAINLCEGNRFITRRQDKIDLGHLCSAGNPLTPEEREKFLGTVEQGVFYTSVEIKEAAAAQMQYEDLLMRSRMVGVLIFKGHLTFVYCMNNKLIEWHSVSEAKTVRAVEGLLSESEDICAATDLLQRAPKSCMVCGWSLKNIPHLAFGRRWGKKGPEKDAKEIKRRLQAKTHINSHNLQKIFDEIFYIPVSRTGVPQFRFAGQMLRNERRAMYDTFFNSYEGVSPAYAFGGYQGVTAQGQKIAFLPVIDLAQLDLFKRQNIPMHLYVPAEYAEVVCRVMGPLILSLNDIDTSEPLDIVPYDQDGGYIDWEDDDDDQEEYSVEDEKDYEDIALDN